MIKQSRRSDPNGNVSILTVARKAGCSIATVSNVLNSKGRFGAAKRRKVLRAVKKLGYKPSLASRNLRHLKSEMVGLFCYSSCLQVLRNPLYAEIMEGLEERLTREGYNLLLVSYQGFMEHNPVPDFLIQGKVEGMILMGGFPSSIVGNFCKVSSPVLLLDSEMEWPIDSIISDGFTAEANVVKHLVALGHRKIVMLAYKTEDSNIQLRKDGFLNSLQTFKIDGGANNVIDHLLSDNDIYAALRTRLKSANPPTAIVAAQNNLATAMIERLTAEGIRVPEDLSFVGYDNHVPSTNDPPFLSTVRVNRKALGQIGADLILKRIASRDTSIVKLRLQTEFVLGNSIAPPLNRI